MKYTIAVLIGACWVAGLAAADFSDVPGVVVNHSPKSTRMYIGSPSIAILPNGHYIASHDFFGPGTTSNQTLISESQDAGETWAHISTISGQFWSNLFWHNDALYLMGTSGQYGQCIIRKSTDFGRTWTTPTDANTGILFPDSQYHTAPMPVVIHNGRVWRTMEDGQGGTAWGKRFRAFVMSAPVDADLLKASSWTATNRIGYDADWLDGRFGGFLEGNAVVDPNGNIVNILRVDYRDVPEKAAIIRISSDGKRATFDPDNDFITFPGGCKKFVIRSDPVSDHYWTLSNTVLPQHIGGNVERIRNAQVLMSSADLHNWTEHLLVLYHPNVSNHGFQYLDWQFEGDDIIAVSRTAYDDGQGGADNQHNANFMTFHRIENFRGPHLPYWTVQPTEVKSAVSGSDATFHAAASNDVNTWRWYKHHHGHPDTEIVSDGRFLITSDPQSTTLHIASISSKDVGYYYCTAENAVGIATSETAALALYERKLLHHFKLDDVVNWMNDVSASTSPILDSATGQTDRYIRTGATQSARNTVVFGEPGATFSTGSSILFGGTLERVELGEISPGGDPFTIAFWFKLNQYLGQHGNQDHIISSNNLQTNRWNVQIQGGAWTDAQGRPALRMFHDGYGAFDIITGVEAHQWRHVVITRSNEMVNNFRIYVDGDLRHTGTNRLAFTNAAGGRGVWLGRRPNFESAFNGWIDDVRFYNYAIDDIPDLNGDGIVDLDDLAIMAQHWLMTDCGGCGGADLSINGTVNVEDLTLFVRYWLYSQK